MLHNIARKDETRKGTDLLCDESDETYDSVEIVPLYPVLTVWRLFLLCPTCLIITRTVS